MGEEKNLRHCRNPVGKKLLKAELSSGWLETIIKVLVDLAVLG